jgi:hypothetical protein
MLTNQLNLLEQQLKQFVKAATSAAVAAVAKTCLVKQ